MEPPAGAGGRTLTLKIATAPVPTASMEPPAGAGGRLVGLLALADRGHAASMEPPAGAGGRPTISAAQRRCSMASMEPPAGAGGRLTTKLNCDCWTRRGFNGATSRSWWKDSSDTPVGPSCMMLQWSHQPELVEGLRWRRQRRRQQRRFNGATSRSWWKVYWLSAELLKAGVGFNGATSRSWWKGADTASGCHRHQWASMEPPAGAGGRFRQGRGVGEDVSQLQWSHQPELVEGDQHGEQRNHEFSASMEPPAGAGGRSENV